MEKKELLMNLLFLAITLPIVGFIFMEYAKHQSVNINVNYANPLNLEINNIFIYEYNMELVIYNPNNYSVQITSNLVGVRNSFGNAGPITHGGDLGTVKLIPPKSSITFHVPILVGSKPKMVIDQWKSAGGNLTIAFYYTEVDRDINGVVIIIITKPSPFS